MGNGGIAINSCCAGYLLTASISRRVILRTVATKKLVAIGAVD
jgi:hypothetical protein